MRGTLMAIFAALCWGAAPIAAKLALRNVSPMVGMGVRSAIAAGMVSVWLFTTGDYRAFPTMSSRSMAWLTLEALLATVVGDAAYFYALKHGQAGHVSLIMASSPLLTLLLSIVAFGEPTSAIKWTGAIMVVGGLLLIGL